MTKDAATKIRLFDPVCEYHLLNLSPRVSPTESTVPMGNFNAHVRTDTDTWKGVIEKHGITGLNENGRYLLQLCCSNGLRIMNTFFQHRKVHKYTLGQRFLNWVPANPRGSMSE